MLRSQLKPTLPKRNSRGNGKSFTSIIKKAPSLFLVLVQDLVGRNIENMVQQPKSQMFDQTKKLS